MELRKLNPYLTEEEEVRAVNLGLDGLDPLVISVALGVKQEAIDNFFSQAAIKAVIDKCRNEFYVSQLPMAHQRLKDLIEADPKGLKEWERIKQIQICVKVFESAGIIGTHQTPAIQKINLIQVNPNNFNKMIDDQVGKLISHGGDGHAKKEAYDQGGKEKESSYGDGRVQEKNSQIGLGKESDQ